MNSLSRIPVSVWYLFSTLYCYVIWNPTGYSFAGLVTADVNPAVKVICAVLALIILSLYIVEGHRSLNTFALVLFFVLIGSIFWLVLSSGFHAFAGIEWWGHWIVGLLMTIALQGGRIYRAATGRVPVGSGGTEHVEHHGH